MKKYKNPSAESKFLRLVFKRYDLRKLIVAAEIEAACCVVEDYVT